VSNAKIRLLAMSLAMLAGCGTRPAAPPTAPIAAAVDRAAPVDPSKPRPEIGAWGFDVAGMDRSVAPGASFSRFASGTWERTTQIPDDKADYGMFAMLADRSNERTRQILEAATGAPGTDPQRIGDYYKAFMDEAAIEAQGIAPIQPELARIAKIRDVNGLVRAFAASARQGISSPFDLRIGQDEREPDKYLPSLSQGGLGLPDRDMYDANANQFAKLRDGYQRYIARLFTLAGLERAAPRAAAVYALEAKLAAAHWTRLQRRDAHRTYNKTAVADLPKLAPGIDWKAWLEATGIAGQAAIDVSQPSAITATSLLVKTEPLAVWKDYVTLRVLSGAAPYLPRAFVDANFEMYGKTLAGVPELKQRWKRAIEDISDKLGQAVGQIYVAKYFPPATKAHADQLVQNLLASMGRRLDSVTWMSPETKAKARAKLATYDIKMGYPRRWRDYAALAIKPGDALGNATRANAFEYDRKLAKLGTPIDRDEWGMAPTAVNAYYAPALNEIGFAAAILQPPFFDANADDAINYGGIGMVIGHEISHGFDDQGSQYDATGALKNWWTEQDAARFKAATDRLVAQYNAYCPFPAQGGKPAQCVKGELTLGENIGDLAGLTIAYDAYQRSLGGKPAPVLDGTTGDQRFYLGFAQIWRHNYRPEQLANLLATDPHSPAEFRVSVVRNLAPWYGAFKPRPGDALYLTADQRVTIW
jgi:putative endopeptidase